MLAKARRGYVEWQRHAPLLGALIAALSAAACGDAGQDSSDPDPKDPALCHPPSWVRGDPQTIEDVTVLINALADEHGGTLELPCFVESLTRPLGAAASSNFISAQPAKGARSPRIFLWSGPLVLSVAPEGLGSKLLEMGYETSPTRSIKAEIEFPVTTHLSLAAPYERIPAEPQTRCAACHPNEQAASSVTWAKAYESEVLRPEDEDVVAIEGVIAESKKCDPAVEPERCALLGAVFGQGGIHAQAFSPDARTIYGD